MPRGKADLAVKNDKAIIQDAMDFYNWATKEESSAIKFYFLSSDNYENAASFLTAVSKDVKTGVGTMKVHAVIPEAPKKIWVRNTSCFDDCCFNESFQESSKCEGWRVVDLKSGSNSIDVTNVQDVEVEEAVIPDIGDYVAAVYFEDRKVYIGKVLLKKPMHL